MQIFMQNIKYFITLFVILLSSNEFAYGQLDQSNKEQFVIQYNYARTEIESLTNTVNFISRTGIYLEFLDLSPVTTNWDWYYHLAAGLNQYEASTSFILKNPYFIPYQVGLGLVYRLGHLKSYYLISGIEGGSELFATTQDFITYQLRSTSTARVKLGFGMQLVSLVGAIAELQGSITYPVSPLQFDQDQVEYNFAGETSIKLKFDILYGWGIVGKARFEDYKNITSQHSYFTTRLMAGFFIEW